MKNNIINEAKDQANTEADKILTSAKEQINNEKMKAITELKNSVADLSIDMATMVLKSELKDANKQKELVSSALKQNLTSNKMKATRLSSRYAKSLLSLVVEQKKLEDTLSDMKHIVNVCSENKDLSLLLKSPIVKTDKKISILSEIFSKSVSDVTMSFIHIITSKKREMYLEGIAESFISLYKVHNNIETVTLTTAVPIDENTKSEILSYIKKNGKTDVELTEIIDEDILGGMIVKIGDKQLDASVIRDIKELKKTFNKNLYIKDF